MKTTKTFPAEMSSITDIIEYSEKCLKISHINEKLLLEYRLLIEEVCIKLIEKAPAEEEFSVTTKTKHNNATVIFSVSGTPVILEQEGPDDFGGIIISEFSDYLRQSYYSGTNHITFSTANRSSFQWIVLSIAMSVITSWILSALLTPEQLTYVKSSIVLPINLVFASMMKTLATPLVFFSIAALIVRLYRTFDHDIRLVRLFAAYLITSFSAIGGGLVIYLITKDFSAAMDLSAYKTEAIPGMGNTLSEFLLQFAIDNIIEIFVMFNPLPMLIMAIILGFAACTIFGKEGKSIRSFITNMSKLFGRMLSIIFAGIPIFLYFSLLTAWLEYGIPGYIQMTAPFLLSLLLLLIPMLIIYTLQLAAGGINPFTFIRDYRSILIENIKIGSNINALPYNKRMLARKVRMPSAILKEGLQLGSYVNMDGNCLIISFTAFCMLAGCGDDITLARTVGLTMIIILVSIGAPNQPGSFLIGTTFILSYVGLSQDLCVTMIMIEALTSKIYSSINSIGDIVTIVTTGEKI